MNQDKKIVNFFDIDENGSKICQKLPEAIPNSKFRFILVKNHEKSVKNRILRAENRHFGSFLTLKSNFFTIFHDF